MLHKGFSLGARPFRKLGTVFLCLLMASLMSYSIVARLVFDASLYSYLPLTPANRLLLVGLTLLLTALPLLALACATGRNASAERKRTVISVFQAVVVTLALAQQMAPIASEYQNKSILWVAVALMAGCTLHKAHGLVVEKRTDRAAGIIGLLFAIFSVVGRQLSNTQDLSRQLQTAYGLYSFLLAVAGMLILYKALLCFFFQYATAPIRLQKAGEMPIFQKKYAVLAVAGTIFLCWLAHLFVFAPGILSVDSLDEIRVILGMTELSNHHPIIHQWTIRPFLLLGQLCGSLNMGVLFYSLFQMLVMSLIFAYAVCYLAKLGLGKGVLFAIWAYFALMPINGLYSITMWKDVLFGGLTVLLMVMLFGEARAAKTEEGENTPKGVGSAIALIAVCFLFCVYRNNGAYAFLLGFPFFILINRTRWKRFAAVGLCVVVLVSSYQFLIFNILGAKKSAAGEMLSIPMQQIARTVRDHGEEILPEEYALLDEVFEDSRALGELYDWKISDPVKMTFLSDEFEKQPTRYLELWLRLGLKHPKAYITSFLCHTLGYWYPDEPYWIFANGIPTNEMGIEPNPDHKGLRISWGALVNDAIKTPLVSMLFSVGLMVWMVIIAAALLLLKKQRRLASPLLILAGLWLTTLASPVYCEYRYLYGLIVSAPVCLGLGLAALNKAAPSQGGAQIGGEHTKTIAQAD